MKGTPMKLKPMPRLTTTLRVLLWISIVLTALAVPVGYFDYRTYSNPPPGLDLNVDLVPTDIIQAVMGLVQLILALALGVVFLMWIHRINNNLHVLSGEQMKFTPGWAVGWYFVPVANLYKPYQAMKEIWQLSHKGDLCNFTLLGWWWLLWIVSGILGRAATKISLKAEDVESYATAAIVYMTSDSVDVALNIVALLLVTRLYVAYEKNIAAPAIQALSARLAQPPSLPA